MSRDNNGKNGKKVAKVEVEVEVDVMPKSHNQKLDEENNRRMKGISDVLSSGEGVKNSQGELVNEANIKVLDRFVSELSDAVASGDDDVITEKAEQMRDGLLFAGFSNDEAKEVMSTNLDGLGVVMSDTPEDRLEAAKQRYNDIVDEVEASRGF